MCNLESKSQIHSRLVCCAAVFGVLFTALMYESLFHFRPLGVNVFFTTAVLYAVIFTAYKGHLQPLKEEGAALLVLSAITASTFAIYNNGFLLFLNMVMLIALTGIQLLLLSGAPTLFDRRFAKNFGRQLFVAPFHRIGKLYIETFSSKTTSRRLIVSILLGVAILIPILVVMMLLLTSADMVFHEIVKNLISTNTIWTVIGSIFLFCCVFTFFGSALVSNSESREAGLVAEPRQPKCNLAVIYVVTGALALLLLVFSLMQIVYLAGFSALPYGISYSEYARTGFFQLCAAAAITFALLAGCMHLTTGVKGGHRIATNTIFTLLAFSVLILLVSAFWRMVLYEQEFLFTRLRLYVQAFMVLLAAVTIIVGIKIWLRRFPIGRTIFYTTALSLLALTFFNVDGFIAKQAIRHMGQTEPDFSYLLTLSEDALAHYADHLTEDLFTVEELSSELSICAYFGIQEGYDDLYVFSDAQWEEYNAYTEAFWSGRRLAMQRCQNIMRLEERTSYGDIRSYNFLRQAATQSQETLSHLAAFAEQQRTHH